MLRSSKQLPYLRREDLRKRQLCWQFWVKNEFWWPLIGPYIYCLEKFNGVLWKVLTLKEFKQRQVRDHYMESVTWYDWAIHETPSLERALLQEVWCSWRLNRWNLLSLESLAHSFILERLDNQVLGPCRLVFQIDWSKQQPSCLDEAWLLQANGRGNDQEKRNFQRGQKNLHWLWDHLLCTAHSSHHKHNSEPICPRNEKPDRVASLLEACQAACLSQPWRGQVITNGLRMWIRHREDQDWSSCSASRRHWATSYYKRVRGACLLETVKTRDCFPISTTS